MSVWWPVLAAPLVAVLAGALLRKRTWRVYWTACGVFTVVLSAAFYVTAGGLTGPPYNARSALAAVFVAAPMFETFGIERLTRTAPSVVLSIALGLLGYVPAFLATLILATNVGLVSP